MGGIKMKYCSKCGSPINDDAVFCAGCGTRVSDNNTNQNVENLQPTAEQTTNEENPNVTNTVPLQQQSVYENIGTAEQKPKKKSKKVLFISIAVVLVLCITAGIIFVPSRFSGGAPKIVQNDKDVALFDITFEEFKSRIIKNFDEVIDSVTDEGAVYDDLSAYELQKNRYLETLTDENCWTTTENKDGSILHVWQYEDNDTLCDEMAVSVDSNSNKVKGIMVTTYDQSLMTRTLVASYIIFGNTLNAQNIETLVNVTIYCANEYNENPLLFIGDKGIMMNEVSGTLIASFIPAKTIKDNYSSSGVCIDNDDLYRFDKVLSKKYGIEYEWYTLDEFYKVSGG
uniref:zinc ribbon domain-containing protein n=1 Tax=Ruminococcus bromii TaxID=40518 RepID=UPI0040257A2B